MNILVTGGLGFIGHNVVHQLEKAGHSVVVIDNLNDYNAIPQNELQHLIAARKKKIQGEIYYNDILQTSVTEWAIKKHQIDTVVHLASYPRQKTVEAQPELASQTMIQGLVGIITTAINCGVKKFVYISSSMVYGSFDHSIKEYEPCYPQGLYAILKLAGEGIVEDYARRSGIAYTIIRPSAVYGPLDVKDRVVAQFLIRAMKNETVYVNGLNEKLDFTYVDDVAIGIAQATISDAANRNIYNLTRGNGRSILDAANLAVSLALSGNVVVREPSKDFPSRGGLNIDAAKHDFGYNPTVDIEQGFRLYYDWLLTNR